jgi:hypothetical protein
MMVAGFREKFWNREGKFLVVSVVDARVHPRKEGRRHDSLEASRKNGPGQGGGKHLDGQTVWVAVEDMVHDPLVGSLLRLTVVHQCDAPIHNGLVLYRVLMILNGFPLLSP